MFRLDGGGGGEEGEEKMRWSIILLKPMTVHFSVEGDIRWLYRQGGGGILQNCIDLVFSAIVVHK